MKTWLFNPFKFIAGYKALILGIAVILLTAVVCFFNKLHLDGVIDVHGPHEAPFYVYLAEAVIDWLLLVIPLYLFGRGLSDSSIRFIDIAGTEVMARYPMFFVVLVSILTPNLPTDPEKVIHEVMSNPMLEARLLLLAFLALPFTVWAVVLMYNAYRVSTNLKGPKAVWSFVASIIIAEILSKIIITSII
jgi:hypothetical protein